MSKMMRRAASGLPNLSGIKPLCKTEIKRDFRDMEANLLASESDSESSVLSEECLPSVYPVKPRSVPKWNAQHTAVTRDSKRDFDDSNIQDTYDFLKLVESVRSDVFEAERERENLELAYQSLRDHLVRSDAAAKVSRQSAEAYVRALQAASRHHLREHALLSRRNSAAVELYNAIVNRKGLLDTLQRETSILQSAVSTASADVGKKKRGAASKPNATSTINRLAPPLLMVDVTSNNIKNESKTEPPTAEVEAAVESAAMEVAEPVSTLQLVIVVGTHVETPFGTGIVKAIRVSPELSMIHLQLSFGASYVPLATLLSWKQSAAIDMCSREAVTHRLRRETLGVTADMQRKMQELLAVDVKREEKTKEKRVPPAGTDEDYWNGYNSSVLMEVSQVVASPFAAIGVVQERIPLHIDESSLALVYMPPGDTRFRTSELGATATATDAELFMGVIDCNTGVDGDNNDEEGANVEMKPMHCDEYANELECELAALERKAKQLDHRLQRASRKVENNRQSSVAMQDKLAAIRLALVTRRIAKRTYTAAEMDKQPVRPVNSWSKHKIDSPPVITSLAATPKQTRAGKRRNSFSKSGSPAEKSVSGEAAPEEIETITAEAPKKKKRRRI